MRITIYIFKTTPYCKPSNCINKVYPCERSGALAQGLPVSLISMPGALLDCFDLIFELADILLKKKKSSFLQKLPRGGSEAINTNLAPALQSWLEICSFSSSLEDPGTPSDAVQLGGVPGWEGETAAASHACSGQAPTRPSSWFCSLEEKPFC